MNRQFFFSSIAVLIGLLSTPMTAHCLTALSQSTSAFNNGQDQTNRLIIKLQIDQAQRTASNHLTSVNMQRFSAIATLPLIYGRSMGGNAHVIILPYQMSIAAAKRIALRLQQAPAIQFAEPDIRIHPALAPNDPLYINQWNIHSSLQHGMNLPLAWNITTGSATTTIANLDTGLLSHHVDFTPMRLLTGYDMISDILTANDGDGRDPDPSDPGDWITLSESIINFPGCPVTDSSWHGTHVAGIIGASANNNIGITGINWQAKILPVRVLGKCGGSLSDVIDGMIWAAGLPVPGTSPNPNPADILNMSMEGTGVCGPILQQTIDRIIAAGKIIVVAAGNNAIDAKDILPANCKGVITVAAHGNQSQRAFYSNIGQVVDIMAPGGEQVLPNDPGGILSTLDSGITVALNDNSYRYYQGTSMATPHISGLISLMLAVNPALGSSQILAAMQSSVRPFNIGGWCATHPGQCGAGIADAQAAVLAVAPPTAPGSLTATAISTTQVNLNWIDQSINEHGFKIERKTATPGSYQLIATVATNTTHYMDTNAIESTMYFYRIQAFHPYAHSFFSKPATASTPPTAPTSLTASVISATRIKIRWKGGSPRTNLYIIERSSDGLSYKMIATSNKTAYIDAGLHPSRTYFYRVRASQMSITSAYSNTASATTFAGQGGSGSFDLTLLFLGFFGLFYMSIRRTKSLPDLGNS